jgi:hypothetical protein
VIPYSRLILSVRNEEIIMLNGYCLMDEVVDKTRVEGLMLEVGDFVNKRMGIVTHNGSNNSYYIGTEQVDAEVEVGDKVVLNGNFFGYLEDNLFAELPKGIGYCQKCWINGKI